MPPIKVHRTAAFRLALGIALLFSILTAVLFAIVYWDFSKFARIQLQTTIEEEAMQLAKEAEEEGVAHLAERLLNAQAYPLGRTFEYTLLDASGARVMGQLPTPAGAMGWLDIPVPGDEPGETAETAVAFGVRLADGSTLVVARDTDVFLDFRERVAKTLAAGAGLTVLLALIGGAFISRRSLRRVDEINTTAARIIGGDLSQRLPIWGSGDEFDRLSEILNRMLQRIERLMLGVRHVSSDIAHDLRTPLARLRQGLELLAEEASTADEFRSGLDKALSEVDGVLGTFAALLRISEVEAGSRAEGFRGVDLGVLCQKLHEAYAAAIEDGGRTLLIDAAPGLLVRGDPELLIQAIANLIENAVRHTPTGSAITVSARRGPEAAELIVADNGPGIPQELRQSVLGRFTRLDQSRGSPGHGLGLALVAAVADLHGATLRLEDNRPGLRVVVNIPRASVN